MFCDNLMFCLDLFLPLVLHYGSPAGGTWQTNPDAMQGQMGTGEGDASASDASRKKIFFLSC